MIDDLAEIEAERDRLRVEADKWHQQWVVAHNRMDRLRAAVGRLLDAGTDVRVTGNAARTHVFGEAWAALREAHDVE